MESHLSISVIIPTYNRKAWLRQTLDSLAQQAMPAERFEVIVVDDGSEDGTAEIASETFPFSLRYIRQVNQGDAAARNTGAEQSQADILVFLDDDILVSAEYLACLIPEHISFYNRIVVGTEVLWLEEFNPLDQEQSGFENIEPEIVNLPFAKVCSNNMSVRRQAYHEIGMMQGLDFPGSSIWCDVDFAYRAYQQGFEFFRSTQAICWHRDYVAQSLDNQKKRMKEVAYRAVSLFQKHPDLLSYLPMFDDKTTIALEQDPPGLIARKFFRGMISSRLALSGMERFASLIEANDLAPGLVPSLERWIVGGYIYRGYREGLRDLSGQSGLRDD